MCYRDGGHLHAARDDPFAYIFITIETKISTNELLKWYNGKLRNFRTILIGTYLLKIAIL